VYNQSSFSKASELWNRDARVIGKLASAIDADSFEHVMQAIYRCKRAGHKVLVTGRGASGAIARKAVHNLMCVDIPAVFMAMDETLGASLGLVQKGDIMLLISKGGCSEQVLRFIPPAKQKGATIIGVTQNPTSPLNLKSDLSLCIPLEREHEVRDGLAISSTLAMIAVFDAIAVLLADTYI